MYLALLNLLPDRNRPAFREERGRTPAGTEYDRYEPRSPTGRNILVVSGFTTRQEKDPRLIRFARALARSGLRVHAVALPGLGAFRLEETDLEALIDLARSLQKDRPGPLMGMGFSVGAGLLLAAAARPEARKLFWSLFLFGPYYDLAELWDHWRVKAERPARTTTEWDDRVYLRLAFEHRLGAESSLSPDDRRAMTDLLWAYCGSADPAEKISFFHRVLAWRPIPAVTGPDVTPDRMAALSPKGRLASVRARIRLFADPADDLIPAWHSAAIHKELLGRPGPGFRPTFCVTPLLGHVTPRAAFTPLDGLRLLRALGGLFRD